MSSDDLKCLAQEFRAALDAELMGDTRCEVRLPSRESVASFCRLYLEILFPLRFLPPPRPESEAYPQVAEIRRLLSDLICSAVRFDCRRSGKEIPDKLDTYAEGVLQKLVEQSSDLARLLATDIHAAYHNDPAAGAWRKSCWLTRSLRPLPFSVWPTASTCSMCPSSPA